MKPVLKYRGGKSREIPEFINYVPSNYETYYEPFFGGGALYFYLEPERAVINDQNGRLMDFYTCIQNNYEEMRAQLDELQSIYDENQKAYELLKKDNPEEHVENKNEQLYYRLRDMYNHKIPSEYLDAVLYFFINKTAYSGMIRYNALGEYNVPYGRYKNFNTGLITIDHVNLLKRTQIMHGDFAIPFSQAQENDFMFLDPPYDCIFNDYGNVEYINGFGEGEHRRLASEFRKLKCKALMVIGKTPLTEELYSDCVKGSYHKSYAVNIRNRFKSDSEHIIVTNY